MNKFCGLGRLTKEPEYRVGNSGNAVTRFTIAIDRGKDASGNDRGADFLPCIAFGKTGEAINKFFTKGRRIALEGHIQTGSYENKEGNKVYTTDVIVDRFYFCDSADGQPKAQNSNSAIGWEEVPDDEIPFN